MPTKKVAKVSEISETQAPDVIEVKILSVEDKLAVREAQLQLLTARQQVGEIENNFLSLLKTIATKQGLSLDDYQFNLDNLTFRHK